jgi:hypothetical protein
MEMEQQGMEINLLEVDMSDEKRLNRILESVAWGALLIWWGLSFLQHFLPNGMDAAGTGVILLTVNVVRRMRGIPVNGFSVMLGILTLVWGGLDMLKSIFNVANDMPILAILFIVAGIVVAIGSYLRIRTDQKKEAPAAQA